MHFVMDSILGFCVLELFFCLTEYVRSQVGKLTWAKVSRLYAKKVSFRLRMHLQHLLYAEETGRFSEFPFSAGNFGLPPHGFL